MKINITAPYKMRFLEKFRYKIIYYVNNAIIMLNFKIIW